MSICLAIVLLIFMLQMYKAPYDLGMQSPADQEEVIYEIASQA